MLVIVLFDGQKAHECRLLVATRKGFFLNSIKVLFDKYQQLMGQIPPRLGMQLPGRLLQKFFDKLRDQSAHAGPLGGAMERIPDRPRGGVEGLGVIPWGGVVSRPTASGAE